MPVSMAALHSFLNLCLFSRSSTVRDDRLQREQDKRFTAERRRVKETGVTFFGIFFILTVFSQRNSERERETKRERAKIETRV